MCWHQAMMKSSRSCLISSAVLIAVELHSSLGLRSQSAVPVEFDVVSIKRNTEGSAAAGGMRTLQDGTFMMTNLPLISIIGAASPVPVLLRDILGLPVWIMTERYD